jgi:hypothetical protein
MSMELSIVNVRIVMALSKSVEESLKEAEASLRNALAFAARQERPVVCTTISKVIQEIETLQSFDSLMDKLENRMKGDSGDFGTFFRE